MAEKIELWEVEKLTPYDKNARTHSEEQVRKIAASMSQFGFTNPILVDSNTGIIAGHGRLQAAKLLGLAKVPVIILDHLNEQQKRAYVLADNRLALDAGWDTALLHEELKWLEDQEFDLELTGFSEEELSAILDPTIVEPEEEPDVSNMFPKEAKTKPGDIYILGNHRLMCGDSTDINSIDKLMNGNKAEFVFTDPPYNQETDGGFNAMVAKALRKQSSEIEHLCNFNPETFLQTLPLVFDKNRMNALVFCNKDLVVDYLNFARESGYSYNILFWKKPSAIPIGGSYRPDVEYLLNFRKTGVFNGGIEDCDYSKCLEFGREKEKVHPTMKPVEMIENQIKICSNKNGNVLDFFGGSGSTMMACEKQKRKCFMMELDPKYCDVIISRWCKYTGIKNIKLNDSEIEWNG